MKQKVKVCFNIAQYLVRWTAQNVVHFTPWQPCSLDTNGLPSLPIKRNIFRIWAFFEIFRFPDLFWNSAAFYHWSLQIIYIYIYMKVLLFSTSFVISVLFGDVETGK